MLTQTLVVLLPWNTHITIQVIAYTLKAALTVIDGGSSPFVKTLTAPIGFATVSSGSPHFLS